MESSHAAHKDLITMDLEVDADRNAAASQRVLDYPVTRQKLGS
jgi:hypothetical protein